MRGTNARYRVNTEDPRVILQLSKVRMRSVTEKVEAGYDGGTTHCFTTPIVVRRGALVMDGRVGEPRLLHAPSP